MPITERLGDLYGTYTYPTRKEVGNDLRFLMFLRGA